MKDAMTALLWEHWLSATRMSSTALSLKESIFKKIMDAYSEPHRHYHNVEHLVEIIDHLEKTDCSNSAITFAVFYHDIVYAPGKSTNEKCSADWAIADLRTLNLPEEIIQHTCTLILATKRHRFQDDDACGNLFLDADMAILGSAPARYQRYLEAVRQEYRTTPDVIYKHGRKQFLTTLLKEEWIYHTDNFRQAFEKQAHVNIQEELERL